MIKIWGIAKEIEIIEMNDIADRVIITEMWGFTYYMKLYTMKAFRCSDKIEMEAIARKYWNIRYCILNRNNRNVRHRLLKRKV